MAYPTVNVVNGYFQNNEGLPLSNGYLVLSLSHDSTYGTPPYAQIPSGIRTRIYLDNNGNAAPNQYVWPNSLVAPASSYYTVEAYNNQGLKVWSAPQYWTISSTGPVDLGTLTTTNP